MLVYLQDTDLAELRKFTYQHPVYADVSPSTASVFHKQTNDVKVCDPRTSDYTFPRAITYSV